MACYPLRFCDADFPHHFMWFDEGGKEPVRRWVPYGMPRINPTFQNMAFFLFGKKTGKEEPYGTGVLVGLPGGFGFYLTHTYAITCHHCLLEGGDTIRINTRDGKSRLIQTDPNQWVLDIEGDLAAIDVTDLLDMKTDEFSVVPNNLFATKEFMQEVELGVAEDGIMLGMFVDHVGKERNLVASRSGNVSLLASETDPLKRSTGYRRPSHLFDIKSRPGFSGSPVFVYRTPTGDLRSAVMRGGNVAQDATINGAYFTTISAKDLKENTFIMMLGIHTGQYSDTVLVKKTRVQTEAGEIKEGDRLAIPNSIAVVAPVADILALLDDPRLVEQRKARDMAILEKREKENTPQPESSKSERPTIEGDEQHKERFTALLDAAVGKPKRAD